MRRREGIYRSECHNETVAELRRYLPSSSDQPLLSLHDSAMKSNHQANSSRASFGHSSQPNESLVRQEEKILDLGAE